MMPGSRKLSKVGGGGPPQDQGRSIFKGFFWGGGGGGGIEGVRTPSPKPWFVHGNYTEDFQNERLYALQHENFFFAHVKMTQMLISTFISTFITDNTSVSYTPLYPTFIY